MSETILGELTHGAANWLDPSFRLDGGTLELKDFVRPFPREVSLGAFDVVVDEAMMRFTVADRAKSDAWLGPRLHHVLRLRRDEAARRGPWMHLAIAARPDYVVWRFARERFDDRPAGPERFLGPDYKHAFARLWWMAELFRNGDDYGPAALALTNQDITNNLFRMNVAHHRPTVLAAVATLFPKGEKPKIGREANALAKAINAAAVTLQLDAIVSDPGLDESAAKLWIETASDVDPGAILDELPEGPEDDRIEASSLVSMTSLLGELLAEAPIRGRVGDTDGDAEEDGTNAS